VFCIVSRLAVVATAVYLVVDLGRDGIVTWAAVAASMVLVVLWSRWERWPGRSGCWESGICTERNRRSRVVLRFRGDTGGHRDG